MRRQWKGFISGILVTVIVLGLGASALAATARQLNATYSGIQITLDGKTITPKDANGAVVEPFAVDGTTYLPVRAVADALGLGVEWDGERNTVVLTSPQTGNGETQGTAEGFIFSTKQTTKYSEYLDWTTTTSEVTNNSGKDYSYVMVSVTYYSEDGTILGQGSAIISGLLNGQTKTFETTINGDFTSAAALKFQVDTKW